MVQIKQSDRVREIILDRYVKPALRSGSEHLFIRAKDVLKDAEATQDFPRGRTPLICNVLQSSKLLKEAGLEIERVEGPPSRQSRTVVVHYRLVGIANSKDTLAQIPGSETEGPLAETPAQRAKRVTDSLRGLLRNELAEYGGAEGFMRWIRSDGE